jgi:hypothetical protein
MLLETGIASKHLLIKSTILAPAGIFPSLKRLSENTFFDAFLENFVRKESENFLKNWVFGQPLRLPRPDKSGLAMTRSGMPDESVPDLIRDPKMWG